MFSLKCFFDDIFCECMVDAYTGGLFHVEIVSKMRFTHTEVTSSIPEKDSICFNHNQFNC